MSNTYLTALINSTKNAEPLTAAQIPIIQEIKNGLDNFVLQGQSPERIMKVTIMSVLLLEKGLSIDLLNANRMLLVELGAECNFDCNDENVDKIYNAINNNGRGR